ncbi:MAG TPA: XisH family protein [Chthonomonadaceae bacterium]|nr:XisH family protein [Chthonomonadaceae bacterium]
MPARDIYHDVCVRALIKDGWTITDEPLTVPVDETDLFVDIGAERLVTAERDSERIAVEVKSFVGLSEVQDLKEAFGQYALYQYALQQSETDSDRILYLAVRVAIYESVFREGVGKLFIRNNAIRLVVFDPVVEEIRLWIR